MCEAWRCVAGVYRHVAIQGRIDSGELSERLNMGECGRWDLCYRAEL